MLDTENLCLRPWREEDLRVFTAMRNDVGLQSQLLGRVRGSNPEQVREWLRARSNEPDKLFFAISTREEDQACGYLQVDNMNFVDGYADLGICLIRECRGRGLCVKAINLLANYLRDHWNLRKLCLKVRSDNVAAITCYERAGFNHCGTLRQHVFVDGNWHDLVVMEYFLVEAP